MANLDFPASPTPGDRYEPADGNIYEWDGTVWFGVSPQGGLINWYEDGTTFQPRVSRYEIGSLTNLIGTIFMASNEDLFLGSSAEARITFLSTDNNLLIRNTDPGGVKIDAKHISGNITLSTGDLPTVALTVDENQDVIAAADMYVGNNRYIWFGDAEQASIGYWSIPNALKLINTDDGGIIFEQTNLAGNIEFWTGATPTLAMYIDPNLDAYFESSIYLGDSPATAFFGLQQDASLLFHNGINAFYFRTATGTDAHIRLETNATVAIEIDENQDVYFSADLYIGDSPKTLWFGADANCQIKYHAGSDDFIIGPKAGETADLLLRTNALDALRIDNSQESWFSGARHIPDQIYSYFGTDDDAYITHTGSHMNIVNTVGNIRFYVNDPAVQSFSLKGADNTSEFYFNAVFDAEIQAYDKIRIRVDGSSSTNYVSAGIDDDIRLYHSGISSQLRNLTGDLLINQTDAAAIIDFVVGGNTVAEMNAALDVAFYGSIHLLADEYLHLGDSKESYIFKGTHLRIVNTDVAADIFIDQQTDTETIQLRVGSTLETAFIMRATKDARFYGDLGIGADALANAGLTVSVSYTSTGHAAFFKNVANDDSAYGIAAQCGEDDGTTCYCFRAFDGDGNTHGGLGIFTQNVEIWQSSDEGRKNTIKDTPSKVDLLKSLKVRDFKWNKNNVPGTGFVAQELEQVFPEAVITMPAEDELPPEMAVLPMRMIPILVKTVQELTERIETLEGA